jgi:hypothetical protein
MKPIRLMTLAILLLVVSVNAFAESGMVYICSDKSGEMKMTADLVSEPGGKLAVVSEIGSQDLFPEKVGKKQAHTFILKPSKNSLFEVRKAGSKAVVLSLTIDLEESHPVVAQDQEGVKIVKIDAFLNAPGLKFDRQPMSCLETTWKQ